MSDLSLQLQQAASQLPVSSYFDEALFASERDTIFQRSRYVGHQLSVPDEGDFHALPQEGEGRALLRTPAGVELISNVCRHRQAVILKGRGSVRASGSAGNIVCPIHRWTYSGGEGSPAGTLLGAPHFPQDPCLNLHNYPLQEWNGLLFERGPGSRDVAADEQQNPRYKRASVSWSQAEAEPDKSQNKIKLGGKFEEAVPCDGPIHHTTMK